MNRPDSKQMLIAPIEERDGDSNDSGDELIMKKKSKVDALNRTGASSQLRSALKKQDSRIGSK